MKQMKLLLIDYMFTSHKDELKDIYRELREVYPHNIFKIEKIPSGWIFIYVYDYRLVEVF